jgi:hypothetical protein
MKIEKMTASELREYMNKTYGDKFEQWPPTLEVDAFTYAHVFQEMVKWNLRNHQYIMMPGSHYELTRICVGMVGNGLMFKGVELILKP